MERKRLLQIDTIKGVAILLVVMGHVLSWMFNDFHEILEEPSPSHLWLFIYKFHMPLFIFISGLLTYKEGVRYTMGSFFNYILRKIRLLLIPYLIVGPLLHWAYDGNIVWFNYWFLLVLFECLLINVLWEVVRPTFKWELVTDICFYLTIWFLLRFLDNMFCDSIVSNVFELNYLQYLYFFFSLGIICSRRYKFFEIIKNNELLYTICIAYYLFFFFGREARIVPPNFWLLQLARTSMCFACVYIFFNIFTSGKLVSCLQYLGKMSLEIYLIHFFFVFRFIPMGEWSKHLVTLGGEGMITVMVAQLVYSLAISVIVIFICLIVAACIKKSEILSQLLLGRTKEMIKR